MNPDSSMKNATPLKMPLPTAGVPPMPAAPGMPSMVAPAMTPAVAPMAPMAATADPSQGSMIHKVLYALIGVLSIAMITLVGVGINRRMNTTNTSAAPAAVTKQTAPKIPTAIPVTPAVSQTPEQQLNAIDIGSSEAELNAIDSQINQLQGSSSATSAQPSPMITP